MKKVSKILTIIFLAVYLVANYLFFFNKLYSKIDKIAYTIIFAILVIIISSIIRHILKYYKRNNNIMAPEKVFLIISISLGLAYLIFTPLFKGHDEEYHWYKSYAISLGELTSQKNTDGLVGDILPERVTRVYGVQGNFVDIKYRNSLISIAYSTSENILKNDSEQNFIENRTASLYPFVQMLPQAIGISLSRALGAGIYFQAIFGRLVNFIFFIMMGYFSIKILPSKKYFLMALLLSPKVMYISTTLSGDVFTNSIIILFIAYVLNLVSNKKLLSKKDILLLLILTPCVAISKMVYLPVCGLLLILPKECFKNGKQRTIITTLFMLLAIIVSAVNLKVSSDFLSVTNTDSGEQVEYILNNPFKYIYTITDNTIRNFKEWSLDVVGGYMEWGVNLIQPIVISIFTYLIFVLSIFIKEKALHLSKFQRAISTLIFLGVVILIETALYIQWTPQSEGIGGNNILGVQGRYFTPIIILIPIVLTGSISFIYKNIKLIKKKIIMFDEKYIFYGIMIWQLPTLLNIFVRNI